MTSATLLRTLTVGLLALPVAGFAQGFYFNADAGVALAQDLDVDKFIFNTPGLEMELDPGVRLGIAGGFNFNEYVGVQLQTGIIQNEIDDIDGVVGHVPLLADVVFRYDKDNFKLVPFLGFGLGGDVSMVELDDVRVNGGWVDGTASDFVFAAQAFAGLRYRFTDNMSIGGAYKYFYADSSEWDVDDAPGDIEVGKAEVHSIVVDFTMKF